RAARPLAPIFAPVMALRGRLLQARLKRASRILVFSDFVRSWYLRHGAPAGKLILVHMGLARPDPLPRRNRTTEGIRFFYAGGIAPLKGLHVLIEAFCALDRTAELWIAGDLDVDPDYARHLQALARHPGIRFLGRVGREDLWPLLAEADAVVVPSLGHETFSMLAHEAFIAGVPVIASALGALPEVVWHEENGLLVPPGDVPAWTAALRRFASDPMLRARLRAGIPPVRTFAEYVDEVEDVLKQAAG
ncbi:MAG: glycosyltransferase, partial [Anaerolineae bacterium]